MIVAALYVRADGPYVGRDDVDPWTEARDARLYAGPHPVVAHPPCARWSRLAHLHKHKPGKGIGEDGGCFASALRAVRTHGGVLEHPAGSMAFVALGLPTPQRGGWRYVGLDAFPCWVIEVDQGRYGHVAPKSTWLYYVGQNEPLWLDTRPFPPGRRSPGGSTGVEIQCKRQRELTPPAFADMLIALAKQSR